MCVCDIYIYSHLFKSPVYELSRITTQVQFQNLRLLFSTFFPTVLESTRISEPSSVQELH